VNWPAYEGFENFTRDYLNELQADPLLGGLVADYNGNPSKRQGVAIYQKFRTRALGRRADRFAPQARVSSISAYLDPVQVQQARRNLIVSGNCPVLRVLFDGTRAIGVQFLNLTSGMTSFAYARKEVIIGGGAFGSPLLLQASGVGDPVLLRQLGINVVIPNVHVGKHLWDHLAVSVVINTTVRFPFTSPADFQHFQQTNPIMTEVNGAYPCVTYFGDSSKN